MSVVSTITQQSLPPPAAAIVYYKYTLCAFLFRYTIVNIRLLMCAALLLWFSHFLYLVGKKCFRLHPASHPTERNEHFLTVVVVLVVVAKSSTWILHQHKGNALSILQSLYVTRKCACGVCACVCLQVNVFLLPSYLLYRIVSYRFLRFSRCVVSICHLNNYDKQQQHHTVAFRIGCKLLFAFLFFLLLLLFLSLFCVVLCVHCTVCERVHGSKDKQCLLDDSIELFY